MGHLSKFLDKNLPRRLSKSIAFYKAYPKRKETKINQFLDEETLAFLETYPSFKVGKVSIFGKTFKFSHAGSFIHSVEEIFCENIYAFTSTNKAPYILDCGANIGVSAIFFKRLFPNARVVAFEPDKAIFQLLEENSRSYSGVTAVNKAVWNKTEDLVFYNEGALSGSVTTDFTSKNNTTIVPAVDLLEYMNEPVDFLKIDIEGAELIVLQHIAAKLQQVKNLFVEYHSDRQKPQQLQELLSLVANAGFRYYIKEAFDATPNPFITKPKGTYDLQLNIFCYK